ncbi:hypothetical protein O181_097424 [Austropuccinia psidii MF-1]|uniref:Uncharacterized protein n=1 Tax=Austropuccinia psidii MF-1 TaxID=1389203 RepID=A0A9Q3J989_9BASI|nr:hypothetical protein [Austropuccinia psidii MF-1]
MKFNRNSRPNYLDRPTFCWASKSISLSQEHHVESLLNLYGMSNYFPVATPLVPNEHLDSPTQSEVYESNKLKINYRSSIGSLSYISTATRPNISYSVSAVRMIL